jgi:predicted heme/steroid binding protein
MIGYDNRSVMKAFKSKQLNRVFEEIIFANEVYLAQKPEKFVSLKAAVTKKSAAEKVELMDADFVDKPSYTVEELHKFRKHLEGRQVSLKATVYKVSHDIMKRDWIHLGDGTGNEEALTDDIVFTVSHTELKAGDQVVAHGKIVTDKDFGFGYFYPVLGEEATFELNKK